MSSEASDIVASDEGPAPSLLGADAPMAAHSSDSIGVPVDVIVDPLADAIVGDVHSTSVRHADTSSLASPAVSTATLDPAEPVAVAAVPAGNDQEAQPMVLDQDANVSLEPLPAAQTEPAVAVMDTGDAVVTGMSTGADALHADAVAVPVTLPDYAAPAAQPSAGTGTGMTTPASKPKSRRKTPVRTGLENPPAESKAVLLTPEQAAAAARKLSKGYALVPVVGAVQEPKAEVVEGKRARKKVDRDSMYAPVTSENGHGATTKDPMEVDTSSAAPKKKGNKRTAGTGAVAAKPAKRARGHGGAAVDSTPGQYAAAPVLAGGLPADQEKMLLMQTKLQLLQERLSQLAGGVVAPLLATPAAPAVKSRGSTPSAKRTAGSEKRKKQAVPSVHESSSPAAAAAAPATPYGGSYGGLQQAASTSSTPAGDVTNPDGTRGRRTIKQPKFLEPEGPAGSSIRAGDPLKKCHALLTRIMKDKWAFPFLEPVDWVKLGIPTYPERIKHPMDLGTIVKRLNGGQYGSPAELKADVDLVWENCFTFNLPDHDVYKMARKLKSDFDTAFARIPLFATPKVPKAKPAGTPKLPRAPSASGTPKRRASPASAPGADEVRALHDELKALKEQVATVAAAKAAPASRKRGAAMAQNDNIPLTFAEKQQLKNDIAGLTEDKLDHVVRIIQENAPTAAQAEADEIELDFDKLSTVCARKLQRYVKQTMGAAKRKAGGPKRRKVDAAAAMGYQPAAPSPVYAQMDTSGYGVGGGQTMLSPSAAASRHNDSDSSDSDDGGSRPYAFPQPGMGFAAVLAASSPSPSGQ